MLGPHSKKQHMSALEVSEQTTTAAPAIAGPVEYDRARFALSIRERRLLLATGDFIVGGLACVLAYTTGPPR